MRTMMTCGVIGILTAAAVAQPVVPAGFAARKIAPLLDGQVPELSAIDDPGGFGTGVVTATVANGIVNFRLIETSGVLKTLAVWSQAPNSAAVVRVRYDSEQVIDGAIHATVYDQTQRDTHYMTIPSLGVVTQRWERTDAVWFDFDFSTGQAGNGVGAVLMDVLLTSGTQLAAMNTGFDVTVTNSNSIPAGRTDTDVVGVYRDVTGLYGGGILLADHDPNTDAKTAIYELRDVLAGGSYRAIFGPVDSDTKQYGDLAIAASGSFGGVIYITETLTEEIQQVATDGTHTSWATGFVGIDSLSISPDGESMYVGDLNGVWLIRPEGNVPGPAVLATDPSASGGTVLGGSPVNALRVIFTEPVTFEDTDLTITDGDGQPVGFDASGSGSQFMIIGLAAPLSGDTYTVTVADTVVSATTGQPLDGDSDGIAGGDAVLSFTHACTGDIADDFGTVGADGMVSFGDFLALLGLIGPCP